MTDSPLTKDPNDLTTVIDSLKRPLHLTERLPHSPFASRGVFSFTEYETFTSLTFGRAVAALASEYGDDRVFGAVIDPLPETYFEEDGEYGAFQLSRGEIITKWRRAMEYAPSNNAAASIQVQSKVLALTGSSGKWSIWGERAEGIAIVRTDYVSKAWQGEEGPFADVHEALQSFVEPNYTRGLLPDEFVDSFLNNFG